MFITTLISRCIEGYHFLMCKFIWQFFRNISEVRILSVFLACSEYFPFPSKSYVHWICIIMYSPVSSLLHWIFDVQKGVGTLCHAEHLHSFPWIFSHMDMKNWEQTFALVKLNSKHLIYLKCAVMKAEECQWYRKIILWNVSPLIRILWITH